MGITSGIKSVKATINGQSYTLTKNEATGKYEATITAPATSSYKNNGHYFPVKIDAEDQAGNVVTADDTHATLGASLKLRVKEKVAPAISKVAPSNGSYLSTAAPAITAELRDNDSGVDISTLILKIDNQQIANNKITKNAVSSGYDISYTPDAALVDGAHTVSIQVSDNDGNQCTAATTSFTVMTTAPTLEFTAPTDGLKTNKSALAVTGTTNKDATVTIKLNGVDQGTVTVSAAGGFSKSLTLATEGENTITVVAKNLAGVTTTVERKVIYDATAPVIGAITITPNPVDAGQTYVISVEVDE